MVVMAQGDSNSIYSRVTGGLPGPGPQLPEARSFLRVLGGNPHAQLAMVQLLAGAWKNAVEGWRPNPNAGSSCIDQQSAVDAIARTIRYMREMFPEWASPNPVKLDPDFYLPDYPGCDPFTKNYIEEIILGGYFDDGGLPPTPAGSELDS